MLTLFIFLININNSINVGILQCTRSYQKVVTYIKMQFSIKYTGNCIFAAKRMYKEKIVPYMYKINLYTIKRSPIPLPLFLSLCRTTLASRSTLYALHIFFLLLCSVSFTFWAASSVLRTNLAPPVTSVLPPCGVTAVYLYFHPSICA